MDPGTWKNFELSPYVGSVTWDNSDLSPCVQAAGLGKIANFSPIWAPRFREIPSSPLPPPYISSGTWKSEARREARCESSYIAVSLYKSPGTTRPFWRLQETHETSSKVISIERGHCHQRVESILKFMNGGSTPCRFLFLSWNLSRLTGKASSFFGLSKKLQVWR